MTTKTQDSSDKKKVISGEVPKSTVEPTVELTVEPTVELTVEVGAAVETVETVDPVLESKAVSCEGEINGAAGGEVAASSLGGEALPSGDSKEVLAGNIIRKYVYWAMGAGVVPLPLVDVAGVATAQIFLVRDLSGLYGVTFSEHLTKNVIGLLMGSLGNRVLAQIAVGTLFKTLPFGGAVIGSLLAMPTLAAACTYALGKVFVRHFEAGGTLMNVNIAHGKEYFEKQFKKGKERFTKATPVVVEAPVAEAIRA
jgi:uncharacterized protein (DUF697 family)